MRVKGAKSCEPHDTNGAKCEPQSNEVGEALENPAEAAYRFASLDDPATERRLNSYYAEFLPLAPEKLRPHAHAGVEFIYVIQGTLSVHVNGEAQALGDRCSSARSEQIGGEHDDPYRIDHNRDTSLITEEAAPVREH